MELSFFNINDGFSEALVRGLRSGFLTPEDYRRLATADTLEDVRSALEDTDYGTFMQDEPSPIGINTVVSKCREKLADEFKFLKAQAVEPLSTFMDFIAREKMIENIVMLIQGTLNGKPPRELLEKVNPLGYFEGMKIICGESFDVSSGFEDVYKIVLVDTPVGPYFEEFLKAVGSREEGRGGEVEIQQVGSILTDTDLEIMKQTLKKAWLEDLHQFCQGLGGSTAEVMGHILKMEADFRVLLVTLNALNTPLSVESQQLTDRNALYPSFGYLYPEGTHKIRSAWSETTVRTALEPYGKYLALFDQVKNFYDKESQRQGRFQSLEDLLYVENVQLYEMSFEQQYHYGVFYAWVKLREQEIRNIEWICNMILMNKKEHIDDIVPIFQPRA
jgi:V-type H+-transporting ATPase subunit d